MNTHEALILAVKLQFAYGYASRTTKAINSEIAYSLGPESYKKFCDNINKKRRELSNPATWVYFKKEFLNNPVNIEDEVKDSDVAKNWTFGNLLESISESI